METLMDPISQYQQAKLRHQDLINEASHERHFQQVQREAQQSQSNEHASRPLDALMVAVGSRLESVGRAMQESRRQSA